MCIRDRLYTDRAVCEELESEIFMDITLRHYPLRDYAGLWSEMQSVVRSYARTGKRNQNAIGHGKPVSYTHLADRPPRSCPLWRRWRTCWG